MRPKVLTHSLLGLCVLLMVLHQVVRWDWYIEDAGICFAYARNLATGEGLVPYPGGERIEAYSDPTWVALLSLFYALGFDGFAVAKPLALLFCAGTAWVCLQLAGRVLAPEQREPPLAAIVAPLALAANAQFALWSTSGLENALFCFLLAGSIYRTVLELEPDGALPHRRPWSSLLWVLLCWTRPEGFLYAAMGGIVLAFTHGRERWRKTALWLVLLAVPLALSEAARLWYFAWPLPNTFYAKIPGKGLALLDWDARGWLQLRGWADRLWHGWWAPLYTIGLTGTRGWRPKIGLGALGVLALPLLWPGSFAPTGMLEVAWVALLLLAGFALPLLAVGTPGGLVRLLCGLTLYAGLFFLAYADGDWMEAYRFTSFVSPPLAVLFAVGLVQSVDALEVAWSGSAVWGPVGWIAISLGMGSLAPPNLTQTRNHLARNQDVTLDAIHKRVNRMRGLARRTFYEGPIVNLDIDQGAFLWWAPDFHQLDMGKLVDVPMAHHWFGQRAFVREYLFEEQRPTFANVGGWWVGHTGFRAYPEWDQTYFEAPQYQTIWGWWFKGVFARRDLVMVPASQYGSDRRVGFGGEVALASYALPAPWSPGLYGYVEAPLQTLVPSPGRPVKLLLFASQGSAIAASWDLQLGYGIYPQGWWKTDEVFLGRHALAIPDGLAPGTYDLGFLVLASDGTVLPAITLPEGALSDPPVFARGEVRFPAALTVVDRPTLEASITVTRDRALQQASSLDCEAATASRVELLRHRPRNQRWEDAQKPTLARALADCWAGRAERETEHPQDALALAHQWDHRSPVLARVGAPVAERLLAEGARARTAGDWGAAYAAYTAVLSFQPWRSWARRYAEEARDHRLGLVGIPRIGSGGEDELRAFEEKHDN